MFNYNSYVYLRYVLLVNIIGMVAGAVLTLFLRSSKRSAAA